MLLIDFATELVEEFTHGAEYAEYERSALKDLAIKEFTFVRGSRLHFWQQLLYYCESNFLLLCLPNSCCLSQEKKQNKKEKN